ncbi:MAG: hypothetical protein IT303_14920 [Dehalococcoidia bacterium]|nr:hypothetical protein [Dehalococcoidia bacterium]
MTQPDLQCPDCSTAYEHADNYCRKCGMYLAAMRPITPAPAEPRAIEPVRASLPTPVKRAATALAIGTALQLGVGLAGKYLASQAARSAGTAVASNAARPSRRHRDSKRTGRELQQAEAPGDPLANAAAVSETVLIRRVWIRRD